MPIVYVQEMICDWIGASRAQGYGRDVLPCYEKNKGKMRLHAETRRLVEGLVNECEGET